LALFCQNKPDRASFRAVRNGLEIAVALRKLYPTQWKVDNYARLLVNSDTLERLKRGESAGDIQKSWAAQLEDFKRKRADVLIYN